MITIEEAKHQAEILYNYLNENYEVGFPIAVCKYMICKIHGYSSWASFIKEINKHERCR